MTQAEAFDLLKLGNNVFITGAAGAGKTHLLNMYIDYLKAHHIEVGITASTGIAATHMNGLTIHAWSGIGIDNEVTPDSLKRIKAARGVAERIKNTKVLIIDEVSMLHSYRLDMVNLICQKIRNNPAPFGGLQVVLCGDFFQLPPIRGRGEPEAQFVVESNSWKSINIKICYLQEQFRQDDQNFLDVLNQMRSGEVDDYSIELLQGRLNQPSKSKIRATQLFTTNSDVDGINNYELNKLHEDEQQFSMTTKGARDLIDKLQKGCMAPADLKLKVGAIVMFVRNNFERGYVNGTLGKVIEFDTDTGYPIIKTVHGKKIKAAPERWAIDDNDEVLAEIAQVPLRLAWAITVHKSQGMSLDAAVIDLSKAFVEGMGYVALSRVRSLDGISLLGINNMALRVHPGSLKLDKVLRELSGIVRDKLSLADKKQISQQQKDWLMQLHSAPLTQATFGNL